MEDSRLMEVGKAEGWNCLRERERLESSSAADEVYSFSNRD